METLYRETDLWTERWTVWNGWSTERQKYKLTDRNTGRCFPNPQTADQQKQICHLYSNRGYIYRTRWNVFQIFKKHSSECLSSSDAVLLSLPGSEWNPINMFCLFYFGFLAKRFLWRLSDPSALCVVSFVPWMRPGANRRVSGSIHSETERREKEKASQTTVQSRRDTKYHTHV